uniref:Beta-glucuronidase C-terminal domain-containing protein n=1 Tax=Tetradesmus obliquus TaxID=3088 RepID=A0A383V8Y6_TETOB|eukprot:jgi/Sobl393_1/3034/SZX61054.1
MSCPKMHCRISHAAWIVLLGLSAYAVALANADPLGLRLLLSSDPVPDHVLAHVQQHGSSSWQATQADSSSSQAADQRRQLHQAIPIRANALNVRPGLQASAARPASWATASITPSVRGFGIPKTFLGISHEWTNVEELNQPGSYLQLIQDLTAYGGGPLVVRIGGGSTDQQTAPAPASTWNELRQLQYKTGVMYIFGLNFKKGDAALAKSQMDTIFKEIPYYSIMSFELGNEPNFYEGIYGKSSKEYIACCFVNDWERFVKALSCKNPAQFSTCTPGQFAGPVWGHVNMFPRTMEWFLKVNYPYMNLVTVHWYKARREDQNTVQSLLAEGPVRTEMANLRKLVEISRRYGKDLRVAEMNTISNSGREGLSDSLAAALWTLDGALEVANTGAVGINLHWGDGLALYAALLRQKTGAAYVKPTYYAYLLLQMALGSGAQLVKLDLQALPGAKLKVWPLLDTKSGAMRIVLINKHATAAAGMSVRLPDDGYADGKLLRLLGKRGLEDEWGVSLGNMTYNLGGQVFGDPAGEIIAREVAAAAAGPAAGANAGAVVTEAGSSSSGAAAAAAGKPGVKYTVIMPAGSAALLVIPKQPK